VDIALSVDIMDVKLSDANAKKRFLAPREGGTASQSWDKITSEHVSQAERDATARDLKLYCQRDTLAMVAIWRYLG